MKKLIMVFGQPGSGRKTLIENINSDTSIRKVLGISDESIFYKEFPYNRDDLYEPETSTIRFNAIYECIFNFIKDDKDTLIIPGEFPDFEKKDNSILKKVSDDFPNLAKEIVLLCSGDLDVAYNRLKETDWFKANYKKNLGKYTSDWFVFSVDYMKKGLFSYQELGYKVTEIDTTNGYSIIKQNDLKVK